MHQQVEIFFAIYYSLFLCVVLFMAIESEIKNMKKQAKLKIKTLIPLHDFTFNAGFDETVYHNNCKLRHVFNCGAVEVRYFETVNLVEKEVIKVFYPNAIDTVIYEKTID